MIGGNDIKEQIDFSWFSPEMVKIGLIVVVFLLALIICTAGLRSSNPSTKAWMVFGLAILFCLIILFVVFVSPVIFAV